MTTLEERSRLLQLSREDLRVVQLRRLNELLTTILPGNAFYRQKLASRTFPLTNWQQLSDLPFTCKEELSATPDAQLPVNATFALRNYVRFHRTSGTRGRPLPVLDTSSDWQWWIDTWQFVLDAANVGSDDRVFMAFSFGPFIGFWSAHDAVIARGALAVPGGGLSSLARLELMKSTKATVVCCTPSYALRLAEVAQQEGIILRDLAVDRLIVAGEPGGSNRAIRERIDLDWGADVIDHAGATEVGPWGCSSSNRDFLQVIESEFIPEFLRPGGEEPAVAGQISELVLTSLGRIGAPVIRYRTGDLVRPSWPENGCGFVRLEGGVLGRRDDMLIVRGVNLFPSSLDAILREFADILEYRVTVDRIGSTDTLKIEIEDRGNSRDRVTREIEVRLGLRADVESVAIDSLPRFEGKSRRYFDLREQNS